MKDVLKNLTRYPAYLLVFCLTLGLSSCSDDDDGIVEPEPTGFFEVGEEFTLSGNTLTLESINVGQDSWLVAVPMGQEDSRNFISDTVRLQEGVNTNVQLTLDEGAITDDTAGEQIVLKLYSDNPNQGNQNELDENDQPIMDENNEPVTEVITVFPEDDGTAAFADFDQDGDGVLDENEVPATYQNNFEEWDADDDGVLSSGEFYDTTFWNTDADDDDLISEEEWNLGYDSMYGDYIEDDFATFDADADGFLNADEWDGVFADSDMFETYDADDDTFVSDTEWDTGLFGDWDLDDDTFINEDEFNNYVDYVSFW